MVSGVCCAAEEQKYYRLYAQSNIAKVPVLDDYRYSELVLMIRRQASAQLRRALRVYRC